MIGAENIGYLALALDDHRTEEERIVVDAECNRRIQPQAFRRYGIGSRAEEKHPVIRVELKVKRNDMWGSAWIRRAGAHHPSPIGKRFVHLYRPVRHVFFFRTKKGTVQKAKAPKSRYPRVGGASPSTSSADFPFEKIDFE